MNLRIEYESIAEILEEDGYPVYLVNDAGHHLYFGNPQGLVEMMIDEIETI